MIAKKPPTSGRQIRLFLADGTPDGLLTAEVVNWTGKALAAPRSRLPDLIRREEAGRTGVYFLLGPDPDRANGARAYIGEADAIGTRLRRHDEEQSKDFFDRVGFVVAKDENLTKGHARYLESQLIQLTKDAGSVTLANSKAPVFARLPEADLSDMAFFLDQIRIVLPIIGLDLLRPAGRNALLDNTGLEKAPIFELTSLDASATAQETDRGFIVLSGSTARRTAMQSFPKGYSVFRDQLIADGRLVATDDPALYRFATDVIFSSPSAAASLVVARNANGRMEWRVQGSRQSYKDWRAAQLTG